jgi:CubicO group peptidase (beta-lactamase class C family)
MLPAPKLLSNDVSETPRQPPKHAPHITQAAFIASHGAFSVTDEVTIWSTACERGLAVAAYDSQTKANLCGDIMKRFLKWLAGSALVLVAGGYGFLRVSPPELLHVGTGYSAKTICSNVFVAGRNAEDVLRDDVQAPGHPILKLVRMTVDDSAREVRTSLIGGIAPSIAIHRAGYGCTLVPGGDKARIVQLPQIADDIAAYKWQENPNEAVAKLLADDALVGPGMRAVVVVHKGQIIAERYAEGFAADMPLIGWSMTKTVTGLQVGQMVQAGKLQLDRAALFPAWAGDARKEITLANLLAMESGLIWNEGYGDVSDVTRMLFLDADMAALPMAAATEANPGEKFVYSSGTSVLVSELVEQAVGADAQAEPHRALFAPLGLKSAVIEPDVSGTLAGSSFMWATARDWARLGTFMLAGGVANGKALLPPGWVQWMVTPTKASNGRYGQGHVWMDDVDDNGKPTGVPKGGYRFSGHDGQFVTVVPGNNLIIVRLGLTPSRLGYEPQALTKAVMAAVQ